MYSRDGQHAINVDNNITKRHKENFVNEQHTHTNVIGSDQDVIVSCTSTTVIVLLYVIIINKKIISIDSS